MSPLKTPVCAGGRFFGKRKPGTLFQSARFCKKRLQGLAAAEFATASAAATTTVATTATAIITTSTASATAEFTAWSAESTATTARRTVFARTRFVHGECTAVEFLAMHLIDCCLSLLVRRHGDEGESA
jgi:hypothetical protein